MYQVRFTAAAHADIKSLPRNVQNSLKKEFQKLISDPIAQSLELREPLQGWRSYHWRNYRVIFNVFEGEEVIAVVAVGKRLPQSKTDVYRKLERLVREGKLAERILQTMRGFGE